MQPRTHPDRPGRIHRHTQHTPPTAQIRHAAQPTSTSPHPHVARKPARLPSRTGFFFCMMEPDTARRKRLGRTTQPDRRPHCPLHPYSAGGDHAQISSTTPRRSTATERPAPPAHLRSRPPGGIPDTRSTHPHSPDQTPSRPRWKLCSTRSPTRSGSQTARKPARRTLPNTQQAAPRPPANFAA